MNVVVLGPGPRGGWVTATLARLASAPGRERPLIISKCTREALDATSDAEIETLLLVDPLPDAVAPAAKAAAGTAIGDAVRPHAMRQVLAYELAKRARRTVALSATTPPAEWLAALTGMIGAPAGSSADLLSSFPAPAPSVDRRRRAGTEIQASMAYLQALDRGRMEFPAPPVIWPRELFLAGDVPGTILQATVEIAGRARILAYGPYLPLPTGSWSATVFLGFSPEAARLPFIFEIDTGGNVTRGFFEVERGGIFSLDLDFELTQPLDLVEARLISQESSLEGQVSLIELALRRAVPSGSAA